ncbi:hypothetical protein FRB99_002193 [Tulasnella sp. 403]|nr:hypothetical protein FRB99_002193 [Tulasnella sp. 403]
MGKKSSLQSLLWKHQERSQADDRRRKTLDQRAAALKNRLKGKKRQIKDDSKDSGLDFHGKSIPNPDGRTAVAAEVLPPTWKLPFQMDDRILLLGEGNFSYALSLVDHHNLPPYNIMATTIDSEEECYRKYPEDAKSKVQSLREAGAQVLFEIDATKLHKYKAMRRGEQNGWNKVVFNFPHVGAGIKDQDRNILSNQTMLLGFLRSVAPLLSRGASPISRKRPAASDDDSDDERKPGGAPQPPEPEAEGMDGWSDDEDFQGIPDDERPQEETMYTIPSPPRQGIILVTLRESKPYSLCQATASK